MPKEAHSTPLMPKETKSNAKRDLEYAKRSLRKGPICMYVYIIIIDIYIDMHINSIHTCSRRLNQCARCMAAHSHCMSLAGLVLITYIHTYIQMYVYTVLCMYVCMYVYQEKAEDLQFVPARRRTLTVRAAKM